MVPAMRAPHLLPATFLALAACSTPASQAPPADAPTASGADASGAAPQAATAQEVLANMDLEADPCQDFYRYACGGWLDRVEIPADKTRWGRFNELREHNLDVLRGVLEGKGAPALSAAAYRACMDEAAIEQAGSAPIQPLLDEAAKVRSTEALMTFVGKLHPMRVGALFAIGAGADYDDPNLDIAQVFQGGLGLPDRDYYLDESEAGKALLTDYQAHVARSLELAGYAPARAKKAAASVVRFETALAKAATPREKLRDPKAHYHKIDREGLESTARGLPWGAYFQALGHPDITDINVATPEFFKSLPRAIKKAGWKTVQDYLAWHIVEQASPALSKAFVDEDFAFYGKRLRGQEELEPRWKRCIQATDGILGEDLGKGYVAAAFAGDSKSIARTMIEGIEAAFAAGLPSLSWMDPATRERALEKMRAISNKKIGYPDTWRDYSGLEIGSDHVANLRAGRAFSFHYDMGNVGKPVRRDEWGMSPPTVNAYYNATLNEMVFPAGIMQPPFFSRDWPMAKNFGGIGMVMGHELTHGFDDQGRKFDGQGRLHAWWDEAAVKRFEERAACVEKQYSAYEVQPEVHLNGKLTLGENIADLGGTKLALRAYRAWVGEHGEEPQLVPELTNDQLLLVSFAQIWCGKERPEIERVLVRTDPHSRPRFRVNGPMSDLPEFWQAFSCAEGTPMHPADACEVW